MDKFSAAFAAKCIVGRVLVPSNWPPLWNRLRRPKIRGKSADDAQLKLYGQLVPSGFLNYGYTDDPTIPPEKMCLHDIEQAQLRYATRLADLVVDRENRILDSGCGLGGLTGLLLQRGLKPTALTPNRTQINHIQATYPDVPLLGCKLEQIPLPEHHHAFGTVITSESFQYVNLAQGFAVLEQILRPGGRWILCDYFRDETSSHRSGHRWQDFAAAVEKNGWRITHQEDITPHVLPTIAFIHMWVNRVGVPVTQFATDRLERKQPALHYVLQDVILKAREHLQDHLDIVNPDIFAREKKYLTLVLER